MRTTLKMTVAAISGAILCGGIIHGLKAQIKP